MGKSSSTQGDEPSSDDARRTYAALRERTRRQERRREQLVERLARQQREYRLRLSRKGKS
jgi:hypothetical protein